MHWPQITWIVLTAGTVGLVAAKNGQPKPNKNYDILSTTITVVTELSILYLGHFFG